jgi:hypothetical protein
MTTTWFGPTSPLGSGGAHPPQRLAQALKETFGDGMADGPSPESLGMEVWATGSIQSRGPHGVWGDGSSLSVFVGPPRIGGMSRKGGEMSEWTAWLVPMK